MRCLALLTLLLVGLLGADTRKPDDDPPVPLRRLCIDAPAIVLGVPLDPVAPKRFRVQAVLRGSVKVGEEIAPEGLTAARVQTFEEPNVAEGKPRPRRIATALLFLEPSASGKGWRLAAGGMRCCSEDGATLAIVNRRGSLAVQENTRWVGVVSRVRQDLAAVEQLEGYRRLGRPARRVQAMLSWVQERKSEFTAQGIGTDESPAGWDRLQQEVFDWVFAAAEVEDAWRGVNLYAELNQGEVPRLRSPTFASAAGREFLVKIAGDARLLLGERTRAVQLLPTQAVSITDNHERDTLLKQLLPLLTEKNEAYRIALAQAVIRLSETNDPARPRNPQALPAVLQAYKDSQPGPAREELALALAVFAPPGQWKELTGNPPGVVACLRDFEKQENTLTFWLTLRTPSGAVYEAPTLVIERLNTLGFTAETKRFPVEVKNLDRPWSAGWNGDEALVVQINVATLTSNNNYRVKVEGFLGKNKDRQKWTSEPRKFRIPPRPGEGPGGRGGRIFK